jgi:Transcriptional regulator
MRSVQVSKNKLMAAALELVAEIGYKDASTKKIAQAAGMNEASIFRLFGSKKQLFLDAIFHTSMSGDDIDMQSIWALGDFRSRLEEFVAQCLELCIKQLSVNRMFVLCAMDIMDANFQKLVLSRMLQVADLFRAFLRREGENGEIDYTGTILPDMVFSRLSMAAMYFYRMDGEDVRDQKDKKVLVADLTDFLCGKLRVKHAC